MQDTSPAGALKLPLSPMLTKLVATLALVGATAGVAALGTYAGFTSSTPAQSQSVTSGTLQIDIGATGSETNRLDMAASGVAPGDTIERTVDLTNSGNVDFASLDLTTNATTSSLLDTSANHGLQMQIDECSVPWTETVTGSVYTYACTGGTSSPVLASEPVIESNASLTGLNALTAGGVDHLMITLSLPSAADDTFQTQSSVISYVFSGVQRAGTSR